MARIRCRNDGREPATSEAERAGDRPEMTFDRARTAEIEIDEAILYAVMAEYVGQVIEVMGYHLSPL